MSLFVGVLFAVVMLLLPRLWVRGRAASRVRDLDDDAEPLDSGVSLEPFAEVSPQHTREARAALLNFHARFKRTFVRSEDPEAAVRSLFNARARALQALHEVRMRLPNDLSLEKRVVTATEAIDRDMMERIEDARQRCGAPLVHPGPVDDAFYGAWYRAPNDYIS